MSFATVIVGHGSRDAEAEMAFVRWMDLYRSIWPERALYYAFLELSPPYVGEVLRQVASQHTDVVVVPLSLLPAAHVKNDIPLVLHEIRREFPELRITVTPPLGLHVDLVQSLYTEVSRQLPSLEERQHWVLLLVGRGASDPDANSQFYQIARLLAEACGMKRLELAFVGITWPSLDEALLQLAKQRPKGIILVPYLLFTGLIAQKIRQRFEVFAEQHAWIKTKLLEPLGGNSILCGVVEDRIADARGSPKHALACVSCQYRVPLGSLQNQVGGLSSLLWSVRHQTTHQQMQPHQHAHAKIKKHILICTNHDCAAKGSVLIAEQMQRELRAKRLHRDYKVTRTSCMGRCGEGPTMAVYPDGVWYRQIESQDIPALIDQHLLNDKLLSHRIDSVL
ncbi:MAG: NAD(P)H-dependent oxidoreductase subunit E [Proteobacteria bacterium]|nr:NAD(P)H-dependent oxidoreductase subunit E [Pseudomonadota bacterium]